VASHSQRSTRADVGRPDKGARTIWQLAIDHFDNETHRRVGNLDALIILADEWDQLPEQRTSIENDMRGEARRFLAALSSE